MRLSDEAQRELECLGEAIKRADEALVDACRNLAADWAKAIESAGLAVAVPPTTTEAASPVMIDGPRFRVTEAMFAAGLEAMISRRHEPAYAQLRAALEAMAKES